MIYSLSSPCILHTGRLSAKGYGLVQRGSKNYKAHRLVMGNPEGKVVMHLCDNRACINSEHLRIGTIQDNNQDMVNKGRQSKGSKRPSAKLTEEQIPLIRSYQGSLSSYKVGNLFGVSYQTVRDIWNKHTWKEC